MALQTHNIPEQTEPTFGSILCGVNGSRPSKEAARQAALLADPGSALAYVAVSWEQGCGTSAVATLSHAHAHGYLSAARSMARELEVDAGVMNEHAPDIAHRLLDLSAGHDLLAIGIPGHSRAGGIVIGRVATTVLHRSPIPVLVARRPPEGVEFPAYIVLASDGTPISGAAAELTAGIAARHRSHVVIVTVHDHDAPVVHGVGDHAARIADATGTWPEIVDLRVGPPHRGVTFAAHRLGASLIVTGSRGLSGIPALRSASERIAHAADCSVLVVRR
jgi:nucleotide-binding universal stress UspA family protein